jgi:hypothetical protein
MDGLIDQPTTPAKSKRQKRRRVGHTATLPRAETNGSGPVLIEDQHVIRIPDPQETSVAVQAREAAQKAVTLAQEAAEAAHRAATAAREQADVAWKQAQAADRAVSYATTALTIAILSVLTSAVVVLLTLAG